MVSSGDREAVKRVHVVLSVRDKEGKKAYGRTLEQSLGGLEGHEDHH